MTHAHYSNRLLFMAARAEPAEDYRVPTAGYRALIGDLWHVAEWGFFLGRFKPKIPHNAHNSVDLRAVTCPCHGPIGAGYKEVLIPHTSPHCHPIVEALKRSISGEHNQTCSV
ncbi:Uncharacterised protein [Mycobacteroides abscessus subsp. abscessus]|nr:Uncharacterised protein [Mycobacteroides abscessus subsp. abscessus]